MFGHVIDMSNDMFNASHTLLISRALTVNLISTPFVKRLRSPIRVRRIAYHWFEEIRISTTYFLLILFLNGNLIVIYFGQ